MLYELYKPELNVTWLTAEDRRDLVTVTRVIQGSGRLWSFGDCVGILGKMIFPLNRLWGGKGFLEDLIWLQKSSWEEADFSPFQESLVDGLDIFHGLFLHLCTHTHPVTLPAWSSDVTS